MHMIGTLTGISGKLMIAFEMRSVLFPPLSDDEDNHNPPITHLNIIRLVTMRHTRSHARD